MTTKSSELRLFFSYIILTDTRLLPIDRLVLSYIATFNLNNRGCYVSNYKLSRTFNCSRSTVSKAVSKLVKLKYIISNESISESTFTRVVKKEIKFGYLENLKCELAKNDRMDELAALIKAEERRKSNRIKDYRLFFSSTLVSDCNIPPIQMFLLALMSSYDRTKRGCFAKNKTLAKIVNCSIPTLIKSIKQLYSKNYIVQNKNIGGKYCLRKVHEDYKPTRTDPK